MKAKQRRNATRVAFRQEVGKAKGAVFKKSSSVKGIEVKGYDFEGGLDFDRFLEN